MDKSMKDIHWYKLKDLVTHDYIPFLGGRPGRSFPISNQEIVDLKIDLWTSPSVDTFLDKLTPP
jgi:hypothetical protein